MEQPNQPKHKTKLDKTKLKEALSAGMSLADSARIAGSKAKSDRALSSVALNTIKRDKVLKEDIKTALEDKRNMFVSAITKEKVAKMSAYQLTVMASIMTDKIQLINGLPTQRIHGDIDFNDKSVWTEDKIKQYVIDRLMSGK